MSYILNKTECPAFECNSYIKYEILILKLDYFRNYY